MTVKNAKKMIKSVGGINNIGFGFVFLKKVDSEKKNT